MSEWSSDMSSAPRDGQEIDLWVQYYRHGEKAHGQRFPDSRWEAGAWLDDDDDELEWADNYGQEARVTHWMPLPEPPAAAATQDGDA